MKVKCVCDCIAVPSYATKGSAGCDLINAGQRKLLLPGKRVFIRTGLRVELPEGYEAQVRGRSGLNKLYGLVVPVGTIDQDYRGEIGVVIYNLGDKEYIIQPGERIAQLVISPIVQAEFEVVASLEESERGEGGFGHTGK